MAPRSWTRTIDIECKDFPTGTLSSDVVQWVFDYFKTEHPEFKVVSVQQCSGRVARVTVDKGCEAARPALEELGEVTIHGVQCFVLRPEPPQPRLVNVLVYQYPYEFPNISVADALDKFGAVKEVQFQHWTNLPEVSTGTRVVRMVVDKEIPRFLVIRGVRCKVWYRDQPLTCDICKKGGHKASACPDKGKCLRCHEPGHVVRHCPNPWGKKANPAPSAPPPPAADASGPPPSSDPVVPPVAPDDGPADPIVGSADPDPPADAGSVGPAVLDPPVDMDPDDCVLADAASVAEVVVLDERDNQLDEFDSQSILANCCLEGASSSGELSSSQIHNVSSVSNVGNNSNVTTVDIDNLPIPSNCCLEGASSSGELSSSQIHNVSSVSNVGNSNVTTVETDNLPFPSNCSLEGASSSGELPAVSQIRNVSNVDNNVNDSASIDNVRNVNYYDSSLESSHPLDSEMSQASDPRKRTIEEVSSDDVIEEFSSDSAPVPPVAPARKAKECRRSKRSAKGQHLPPGVASAALLSVSRRR